MKKLVIVLLLGLLIGGSVFAQWSGYGYYTPNVQTITGTLLIINGTLAIVNANNQVYYVPNLNPYYGVNGMYVNTAVAVYGNVAGNFCDPYRFMAGGTWYTFPTYNYYTPPYTQMYVPMYAPSYWPGYYYWYR